MIKFLKDVRREMQKVSWPKSNELTRYTVIVLLTVIFVAVYFTVVDLGITQLLELL
ncbi:preprotein translocase subunit SecE [Tenuibacillus multivorans]|uniref:Protein translocase subunit SecE n=1 Tax=Tenuibacillus multivorans TaxID=237069 RepID=A0A1H0F3Y0_9BACI|nr:preprotein translocase subunit SecE [Tenuibacillus multivorans]GEL78084.1 protein translocase subunit SecE [Tenuibacillus multivorans]SDN89364.1 preprotein translocase subunit SecE [Tenuibacillus multivorans]